MKTLSGTFGFVALAVIAIVTLPSCCRKQVSKEVLADEEFCLKQTFCLKFGTEKETATGTETEYVEVTSKDKFDEALKALKDNGGDYHIGFLSEPRAKPIDPYHPDPQLSIKTDKVTTSEVAQNAPAGESSAYDPNAVYRVRSNSKEDIKKVLDTFQTSSPTPSPQ